MQRPILLLFALVMLSLAGVRPALASPPRPKAAAAVKQRAKVVRQPALPKQPVPPKPPAHSVGHPNDGRLENGVRVDTSRKELRVVPVYAGQDVRWGLPALVHMVERAARGVARRYPGAVLDIGDLSRQGGGEVHRHHSHESGRDADIGFYAVDAGGKQVHARTFIQFDANLASTNVRGARFDVGRTWLLVQHLLTDPEARVSHIFVAASLRQALLAEGKRRGVSRALLTRAQLTMMQPKGAEPHDDHMHVRISCPRGARGSCVELAKETPAPRDRTRIARGARGGRGGQVLRTPAPRAAAPRAAAPRAAKRDSKERVRGQAPTSKQDARPQAARPGAGDAPAAMRGKAQEPMDAVDLAIWRAPGLYQDEVEAEADGAEVKDAIDDSGALKITD